jgi:cellulose synthase/poly-beta-1,6-N-acetylglucosamine synthase-like glycosyltransferase
VIGDVTWLRLALAGLFWVSVAGVLYPYFGYPLLLWLLGRRRRDEAGGETDLPTVTMIVPVHNEASRLLRKIENTAALRYPADKLQILIVSDGSTDDTVELARTHATPAMTVVELPVRRGKASALNAGLANARHDLLVFTDAAIELEPDSLQHLVRRFADPEIGCVSGEDRIAGSGGEAWYGRYELMLRRLESRVHSIVGASGSFYAQRRALCTPFDEGMAPDFLSVLRTVAQGKRAVTAPDAVGAMTSLKDPRQEFERKVRTLIRGMTTLFAHAHLLNPLRYGLFSFVLFSHKVMRWLAPFFLVLALVTPLGLLDSPWYAAALAIQVVFYLGALVALAELPPVHGSLPGKVALYFSSVNAAILAAWFRYGYGVRQEIWTPTRR